MKNKSKVELQESIIENCDSTHLVVYFLRAGKYYTTDDDYFCDILLLAKCPITGKLFSTNGVNYIRGKILHYIGGGEMDYCLINCVPKDFDAIYESWDTVANALASHEGIEEVDCLKELIQNNFPAAKFENSEVENNSLRKELII